MRGIVIAGTHSGCGKTTVTLGILAALKKKGLAVQPFKAGPDFIDAGLHGLVLDRPSRNLDQWMCGPDYVVACFNRHAALADIAVIEGVMGMHDGELSTAGLARLLGVPVLLVVDGYGMAESAGAVVKGFAEFGMRNAECGRDVAGVVFNRVASEGHYKRLKDSVRDVPVFGYLPREPNFEVPHRHLGLTIAEEEPLSEKSLDLLADAVLSRIDVDRIYESAVPDKGESDRHGKKQFAFRPCPALTSPRASAGRIPHSAFRIAVASDRAFSFYYEDNLDLLRDAGAELVRFSPLAERTVPADADAVYIGGGYPELHAEALSRNSAMLNSIKAWADAGRPLYAECGGLMYLSRGLRDFDGRFLALAGVFPFETRMMKKPRLGYREIVLKNDCLLGKKGEKYRGHEFHYSEIMDGPAGSAYAMSDSRNNVLDDEGFQKNNTLASYVHIHFGSNERGAGLFADFIKGAIAG
jgi:cobyrinic acid a,c-diamide synthase